MTLVKPIEYNQAQVKELQVEEMRMLRLTVGLVILDTIRNKYQSRIIIISFFNFSN